MQRIDSTDKDTDAFGSGKHGFKTAVPYSTTTPAWGNALQEEIARVIEGFGVALNPGSFTQLFDALVGPGRTDVVQLLANVAVFGSAAKPNQHPSSASNRWKEIHSALTNLSTSTRVRFLVGDGDADGTFAITFNAFWNCGSGAQNWQADNTSAASAMLLGLPTGFELHHRNAGAGTWTSWPGSAVLGVSGNANVGGNLAVAGSAAIPNVSGSVLVAGSLDVGADIFATDDVIAGDEFQYAPAKARTTIIPVTSALVAGGSVSYSSGRLAVSGAGTSLNWPVRLPAGAVIGQVDVMFDQKGGSACVLQAVRQTGINWGAPSAPSATVVDVITSGASTGLKVISVNYGGLVANPAEDLHLLLNMQNTGDEIYAVRIAWTDPGPRNH